MRLIKYLDRLVNLHKELGMVPPCIGAHPQINNASRVLHHITLFVADDKTSIFLFDEIGHMNQSPAPLLQELLLAAFGPV